MRIKLLFSLLLITTLSFAQPIPVPMNRFQNLQLESQLGQIKARNFTSVKPYLTNQIGYDTIMTKLDSLAKRQKYTSWGMRKLKSQNFVQIKKDNFYLAINPVFDINMSSDKNSSSPYSYSTNTRGVYVAGSIGKKVGFMSSFYESQSFFPSYIQDVTNSSHVAPGMGRVKKFKDGGYDYGMASGLLSCDLHKRFNVTLGHGKQFIGDGYRSFLLSDNSSNFTYLRAQLKFKKWQYIANYALLQNLIPRSLYPGQTEPLFVRKPYSYQYLLFWPVTRMQIGIFQGVVWNSNGDSTNTNKIDPNIFNPVIGVAAFQNGLRGKNNVVFGATYRARLTRDFLFYAQYAVDDWAQTSAKNSVRAKQAYQWGLRFYNAFTIKNLIVQFENNVARPYMYSSSYPAQSYSNNNQSLAHPLGANFREKIAFVNYRFAKDFFIQLKYNKVTQGVDSLGRNVGSNVFQNDQTAILGYNTNYRKINGSEINLTYLEAKLGYVINYRTGLSVFVAGQQRVAKSDIAPTQTNLFMFVGLSSNLYNLYHDF